MEHATRIRRYIENVKEELDYPREFFFEAATQRLWYFHNDTAGVPPPANWTFEVGVATTAYIATSSS